MNVITLTDIRHLVSLMHAYLTYEQECRQCIAANQPFPVITPEQVQGQAIATRIRQGVQTYGNATEQQDLATFTGNPARAIYAEALAESLHQLAQRVPAFGQQLPAQQPPTAPASTQVTFTSSGDNYGQQTGINYGTMTQHQQDIHNHAPNQGAQGSFHSPVTFNQQQTTFNQQGQKVQGDQYNAARDIVQAQGDVTKVKGDYVRGDKFSGDKFSGDKIDARQSQGFINRPTGPVTQQFGDTVSGDKISGEVTTGKVSGAGIAIGHKAQAQAQVQQQQGEDEDDTRNA